MKNKIVRSITRCPHLLPAIGLTATVICWSMPALASYPNPREEAAQAAETAKANTISEKEKRCLATAIYFEARSESDRGQIAVAQVVLNRVKSDAFPDTICSVVYQGEQNRNACQFSFACDGLPENANNRTAWRKAREITDDVLNGSGLIGEVKLATYYHADYAKPRWAGKMKRLAKIGRHVFYRG